MKGSYFLGNKTFETRETTLPAPGRDELLVKNMACGVCGTDVHIYHGDPGSAEVTPPVILGHEFAGEVVEAGSESGYQPGDHVSIDPNMYCGKCVYCRRGKKQLCEKLSAIGVTQNGGFAEYSLIPSSQAYLLNPGLDFESGAMAEPIACCLHGIDSAGIKPGDRVCIIGGGAIGLMMVQLAGISGASEVILCEPVAKRRDIGKRLGAIDCAAPGELLEVLNGKTADIVIECAGNNAAIKQAFQIAGKGASIVLFSVPSPEAVFDLRLFDVYKKELKITGSFINPDTHSRAVALLNAGIIDIKPLVTHRFGLDEMAQAIQAQKSADSVKVIVKPNG